METTVSMGYKKPLDFDKAKTNNGTQYVPKNHYKEMNFSKENLKVLDFGCGLGTNILTVTLPLLLGPSFEVTGLDISGESIEVAKVENAHPNVSYVQGDILSDTCPINGALYDKIVSDYVIHNIEDWRTVLQKLYTLLKSGGQFGALIRTEPNLFKLHRRLMEHPEIGKYMQGLVVLDWVDAPRGTAVEVILNELISIGFRVDWVEFVNHRFEIADFEKYFEFCQSVNPFSSDVPPHLRAEFREIYFQEMKNMENRESVSFVVTKQ